MAGDLLSLLVHEYYDRRLRGAAIAVITVNYHDSLPIICDKQLSRQRFQFARPNNPRPPTIAIKRCAFVFINFDEVATIGGVVSGLLEGSVRIRICGRREG